MTREDERDMACTNWICSQENGSVIMAREVWKAAVKWADSHPQWIPVEEELPKEKGKYMFCLSNGDMCYETYYPNLKLVANVTHWMPIVPPQGKEE